MRRRQPTKQSAPAVTARTARAEKWTKDFASAEVQGLSDAELLEAISKGKPPKMPAYEGKLKDAEIKDLVAYVRSLGKK